MSWTQLVTTEVVVTRDILKVKLTGFADRLDMEGERKECGLNRTYGDAIQPDGEVTGGTVCRRRWGRDIRSSFWT